MCLTLRKIFFAYTFFASIFKQQIQTMGGITSETKVRGIQCTNEITEAAPFPGAVTGRGRTLKVLLLQQQDRVVINTAQANPYKRVLRRKGHCCILNVSTGCAFNMWKVSALDYRVVDNCDVQAPARLSHQLFFRRLWILAMVAGCSNLKRWRNRS